MPHAPTRCSGIGLLNSFTNYAHHTYHLPQSHVVKWVAFVEFARNVVGLAGAHSTEFDKDTPHPVICLLDEQKNVVDMGGTMRLGTQPCTLDPQSKARDCYGKDDISERHRHRYEFNNTYRQQFMAHGIRFAGTSPDGSLVEIIEFDDHPWYVVVQFHPEFKSKPTAAQPLFAGFVGAAVQRHQQRVAQRKQEAELPETAK